MLKITESISSRHIKINSFTNFHLIFTFFRALKALKGNKELAEKFKEFIKADKEKKSQLQEEKRGQLSPKRLNRRESRSRSKSPFSQKISLVNPNALLAPGTSSTLGNSNYFCHEKCDHNNFFLQSNQIFLM